MFNKGRNELLDQIGDELRVLSITLVAQSKLEDQWLYECLYTREGKQTTCSIIARDVTEALFKLDKIAGLGASDSLMNHMLTSPNFSEQYANHMQK